MLACVDVDYRDPDAVAACVVFRHWTDDAPVSRIAHRLTSIEPYVPGQFYRRELPCLLAVLNRVSEPLATVIIDGYVWLGDETQPGLGAHLFRALGERIPVIGVAKTRYASARVAVPVLRGETSTRPLFVSAVGMEVSRAAECIKSMHGAHRLPTLIKLADRLCRDSEGTSPT